MKPFTWWNSDSFHYKILKTKYCRNIRIFQSRYRITTCSVFSVLQCLTCCWWVQWRAHQTVVGGKSPARSGPARSSCPAGVGAQPCGQSLRAASRWPSLEKRNQRNIKSHWEFTLFSCSLTSPVNLLMQSERKKRSIKTLNLTHTSSCE